MPLPLPQQPMSAGPSTATLPPAMVAKPVAPPVNPTPPVSAAVNPAAPVSAPPAPVKGLVVPPTADLNKAKLEKPTVVHMGGRFVLIPTSSEDGSTMTAEQAMEQFKQTGKHYGVFQDEASAQDAVTKINPPQATQPQPVTNMPRSIAPPPQQNQSMIPITPMQSKPIV